MIEQHRIDSIAHALMSLHQHATGTEADMDKAREAVLAALDSLASAPAEPLVVTAVEVERVPDLAYERPRRITSSVLESAGFEDEDAANE